MNTKLTLSLDENVIKEAKNLAKKKGKTLSGIIENYLKSLLQQKENNVADVSDIVSSLLGCIKPLDDDLDYKKIVSEEIFKKYK
ncbi:DUF6364 family protein [Flavobacterium sp.]|uniref:DUF6364 family protein n=1 Tax=Flavobacterium sp. TaxID=239 RepID=UPI0037539F42